MSSRTSLSMSLSERVAMRIASGMEREIVLLREMKQPDQVDRIAPKYVGARDVDAVVVDDEIVGAGELLRAPRRTQARDHAA